MKCPTCGRSCGRCPTCGSLCLDNEIDECEVHGCHEVATWTGWYRQRDGFGIRTGLIQRRNVCNEHKHMLINQHENNKQLESQ
jgi:hypothetical protein